MDTNASNENRSCCDPEKQDSKKDLGTFVQILGQDKKATVPEQI